MRRGELNAPLFAPKPEQLPLFGPVGGEFKRQPRQPLCAELWRVFAVDDGHDDIGCERRKPQEARQVADVSAAAAAFRPDMPSETRAIRCEKIGSRLHLRPAGPWVATFLFIPR